MENNSNIGAWEEKRIDVSKEVSLIWSIANKLRGTYRAQDYHEVIIPMTIIRRLECALKSTKKDVVALYEKDPMVAPQALEKKAGLPFYNTSKMDLKWLTTEPDLIAQNFLSYIKSFSSNVQDILECLDFSKQIEKMNANDILNNVIIGFSDESVDLDPAKVDPIRMGYVFEELIRKFSENAEAGDHYTGRDIISLMTSLALSEGSEDLETPYKTVTILDQAAGTGGMLSTAYSYIKGINATADIRLFAQEWLPESYAICMAEMLIKGQDARNVRRADTFKIDCFEGQKMRLVLENPPFGTPWAGKDAKEGDEEAVKAEFEKRPNCRWPAGLPSANDSQLLFVQSALQKLDSEKGRAVIVQNGGALFTGDTASGESQVRRWLLENHYLEAVIALPTDLFYNTPIQTYLLVLSKQNKRPERKGYVQLIDATTLFHPLRKSLGDKKNEIQAEDRQKITQLFKDFDKADLQYSKVFPEAEFLYREYTIMQPLQRSYSITEDSIQQMVSAGSLSTLYDKGTIEDLLDKADKSDKDVKKLHSLEKGQVDFDLILSRLKQSISTEKWLSPSTFESHLRSILAGTVAEFGSKYFAKIVDGLSVMDKTAVIQKDKKGNVLFDKETKDYEIVKFNSSIEETMKMLVLPYIPDAKAFFEEDLTATKPIIKTGAEIAFTRYFYKYQAPESSSVYQDQFLSIEKDVNVSIKNLFGEGK